MISMFTVCTMLLGIYNELKKNLAYGRLDCISGLRINFVIYFIQHFLFFYVFIFYFFPQLSKTLFDKEFTAFAGQPLAGQPGVEQTTVPLKDGVWKDVILLPAVQNIVLSIMIILMKSLFPPVITNWWAYIGGWGGCFNMGFYGIGTIQ